MVNKERGRERTIEYCGRTYAIRPGETRPPAKQFWDVFAGEVCIAQLCSSLSKARHCIHNHAVQTGAYAQAYAQACAQNTSFATWIEHYEST